MKCHTDWKNFSYVIEIFKFGFSHEFCYFLNFRDTEFNPFDTLFNHLKFTRCVLVGEFLKRILKTRHSTPVLSQSSIFPVFFSLLTLLFCFFVFFVHIWQGSKLKKKLKNDFTTLFYINSQFNTYAISNLKCFGFFFQPKVVRVQS